MTMTITRPPKAKPRKGKAAPEAKESDYSALSRAIMGTQTTTKHAEASQSTTETAEAVQPAPETAEATPPAPVPAVAEVAVVEAAVVEAKPAKPDKPAKQSSTYVLKQMVYAAPDATVDQLMAQLEKLGFTITKSTAQTVRSDFIHSLKALAQLGAIEWPKKK